MAIQNARIAKKKVIQSNTCQQLEKLGKSATITVKNGSLFFSAPFIQVIPVGSALTSMGCIGTVARLLRSLEIELLSIYSNEDRRKKFEKALLRPTIALAELERLVSLCKV